MPIPVSVPLLDHERTLLTSYGEVFGFSGQLPEGRAQDLVPATFTHWHSALKAFIDYFLLVEDEDWEPRLANDREKTWEMYLRRLQRQHDNVSLIYYSRPKRLLEVNPAFHSSFLLTTDTLDGRPEPSTNPTDHVQWLSIVQMKHFYDTYTRLLTGTAALTVSTAELGIAETNDFDFCQELPWMDNRREHAESEYWYFVRTSFEIWSLVRACSVLKRRKKEHEPLIAQALQHAGFFERYAQVGPFFAPKREVEDLASKVSSQKQALESSSPARVPDTAFHDPSLYLEYIPWSDLVQIGDYGNLMRFAWTSDLTVAFDHHLRTEEEVFDYCVISNFPFPDYREGDKITFVASPLYKAKLIDEMRFYWSKWNDCAFTREPSSGEWFILETIPGIRFRQMWDDQDETAARKLFRKLVDEHRLGRPGRVADVLGIRDFNPEYENLLDIIPFQQIIAIDPKPLGGGSRGIVYKGKWRCPRKISMLEEETRDVALKMMKGITHLDRTAFLKELDSTYAALKGQAIRAVEFYGITKTPARGHATHSPFLPPDSLMLVNELATEGSLLNFLKTHLEGTHNDWSIIFSCIEDIANGLDDLHKHNIIHRDLHEDNVLVTTHTYPFDAVYETGFEALVADLGEGFNVGSRDAPGGLYYGNRTFWAPELWTSHRYSLASDMYAFGCLIRRMAETKFEVDMAHAANVEREIPICILILALRCTLTDPEERITAKDFIHRAQDYHSHYLQLENDGMLDFTKDMVMIQDDFWNLADALLQELKTESRAPETNRLLERFTDRGASIEDIPADEYGIPL